MSRIRKQKENNCRMHFVHELVPNPQLVSSFNTAAQYDVIEQVRTAGGNLFQANRACEEDCSFMTTNPYNQGVSVQDLSSACDEYGLCLRVTCTGPSGTTAMMVSGTDLQNGIPQKMTTVSVGNKGSMQLSYSGSGSCHYINGVRYSTNSF
jgi:hypothetical protein